MPSEVMRDITLRRVGAADHFKEQFRSRLGERQLSLDW
jgi:hypothetical protein